ncbi:ATP-binding protein [Desulfomonile tiedjei]|uniref:histidine kinase n=1 Tax=Desulfomonile tiedjei (strain ATCC 49306 / DSM 6799 / DCB-1) TaxID=706587 RepID=I4C9E2_DESTA|nr:ATP-binding protein [Desulfomonile tiedjei]AFM26183.1 signal transduction histidine kinase [Desulfomonile tiedjei DSM 6799]
MKFKLFHKIFSAFIITILAAIIVLALAMYFTANRRFSEYVTKVEMGQLDDLVVSLGTLYQEKHSWEQFQENPRFWFRFIWMYLPEIPGYHPSPPPPLPQLSEGHRERNLSAADPSLRRQKNQDTGDRHEFREQEVSGTRPLGPPPLPPRRDSIGPRVALFDENKQPVAGPPGFPVRGYVLRPIDVSGQTVGWLGLMPLRHGSHPLELAFIREQTRTMFLAGLCVFALAGLTSFFLSKHLLSPIKKLTEAARELRSLRFSTKIDVHTRDELGQLANAFNSMAQALEKNEMLRKQWTSDVAHELRTPLAILRGEIEAMQDGVREISPERLISLHDETNRIGKLVDDLHVLFVADSENLVQQKYPVKPLRILQEVLGTFETRLEQAGIQVEDHSIEDRESVIIGDEDRLKRLFTNLIENTVRYTDSPGFLRINTFCSVQKLTLVLEDSPPGVPSEALDQVFDRLYRVDKSRSRASGGSGLGLSICREIVTGHGGLIRASHSSLGGLLISIEFPLQSE